MKIELEIPPELNWIIPVFQESAKIRAEFEKTNPDLAKELVIALEQQAIRMVSNDPS